MIVTGTPSLLEWVICSIAWILSSAWFYLFKGLPLSIVIIATIMFPFVMLFAFFQEYEIKNTTLLYRPFYKKIFKRAHVELDLTKPFYISEQTAGHANNTNPITFSMSLIPFKTLRLSSKDEKIQIPLVGMAVKSLVPALTNFQGFEVSTEANRG